jgi:hypothetical protein
MTKELVSDLEAAANTHDVKHVVYTSPLKVWAQAGMYADREAQGTHWIFSFRDQCCFPKSNRAKMIVMDAYDVHADTKEAVERRCLNQEMCMLLPDGKKVEGKVVQIMGNMSTVPRGWMCIPPVGDQSKNEERCREVIRTHNEEQDVKNKSILEGIHSKIKEQHIETTIVDEEYQETLAKEVEEAAEKMQKDKVEYEKDLTEKLQEFEASGKDVHEMNEQLRETSKWIAVVLVFPDELSKEASPPIVDDMEPEWESLPLRGCIFVEGPFLTQDKAGEAADALHRVFPSCRIGTTNLGAMVEIPMAPAGECEAVVHGGGNPAIHNLLKHKDEQKFDTTGLSKDELAKLESAVLNSQYKLVVEDIVEEEGGTK